ncbi:putative transcriptional regulator YdeE [Variovorax sp. TBS-050B]|uniref:GyrI-like domain-containing protein n=1 Tax=Variovorax sp. TBS-050B TaxID=2940551 RepID=UPI0024756CBA|nr:GyrI-like domain-containing protein [Variovorax sp. TBS-050B]MDH6595078.1 putative transcriptional regulator YdeE [Variovorax sp. TBS-050B]
MEPVRRHQQAFHVAGLAVRTTNRDERDPATSRLPKLWGRFFDEEVYASTPHRNGDKRLFGVYSGYESDVHGAFDVTAGVAVSEGAGCLTVEAGDYLVFTARGAMPQLVTGTWQRIWDYFEAHPELTRRYRTDFEAYDGPDAVAIHVGVS